MIGYGCVVGWWDEFNQYVLPQIGDRRVYGDGESPDRRLIALSGQSSIASAYNTILDAYWHQSQNGPAMEAVILLHTDLSITDPDGEAKLVAAANEPDVALVSVEGGDGDRGTEWWECNPIGHQLLDIFYIDFAGLQPGSEIGPPVRTKPRARAGDVEVLEGSILAFSPWAIENLRFDESCPAAFHGYDEICFQATAMGKRNVVVDVDTHHHTSGAYKGQQSIDDWRAANEWSRRKWGKT